MAQSLAGAASSANTSAGAGAGLSLAASMGVGVDLDLVDIKHCFENLIVIDAGANLTNKKYSRDLESVIQRAKDAGILA